MSGTSSQQYGHPPPDNRAYDPRSRSDMSSTTHSMIYEPYIRHELRQAVPPNSGYYQHQILATPPPPRLPSLGSLPRPTPDSRYMLSSDNEGDMNRNSTTMPQMLPLRMHPHGPPIDPRAYPAPYEERINLILSHGREHTAHQMRTFDQESQ